MLQRNMPSLYKQMRESGQMIVNPLDYIPCETYEHYETNPVVLDLLMNRIAQPYRASFWGSSSPTGGQDFVEFLSQAYFEVYHAIQSRDGSLLENSIEKIITMFRRASVILRNDGGCGFGPQLYRTIVAMALLFVPLLAELDIEYVVDLIEAMYTMTEKREMTLRRLLAVLQPQHQYSIRVLAYQTQNEHPTFLAQNILAIFDGKPLDYGVPSHVVVPVWLGKASEEVEAEAEVILSDFGEAFMPSSSSRLYSNVPLSFRTPEACFAPTLLSFPADIWSLACLICEIFGQRPLFESWMATDDEVLADEVDLLGKLPP